MSIRTLSLALILIAALTAVFLLPLPSPVAAQEQRPVDLELSMINRHLGSQLGGRFVVQVLNNSDVTVRNIRVQLEVEDVALGRSIFLEEACGTGHPVPACDGIVDYDTLEWTIPSLKSRNRATTLHKIDWGKTTDGLSATERSVVRLQGRIVESTPRERPAALGNSQARTYVSTIQGSRRMTILPDHSVSYGVDPDAATDTFTVKVANRNAVVGSWLSQSPVQYQLRLRVTPSPGLRYTAAAPAGTTFDAATGIWDIGTLDVWPSDPGRQLDIRVTGRDAWAGPAEEQCLTVEIEHKVPDPPAFWVPVTACMAHKALITEGQFDTFTVYDCVTDSAYPCGSRASVELTAVKSGFDSEGAYDIDSVHRARFRSDSLSSGRANEMILQPEEVVVQISDLIGRQADGTWRSPLTNLVQPGTRDEGWKPLTAQVSDVSPKQRPGSMQFMIPRSTSDLVFLDPDSKPTFTLNNGVSDRFRAAYHQFDTLGTYRVQYTFGGTKSGTTYTDSGTYTFHVGPVAELAVRGLRPDDPAPGVELGQTALTVIAVNNGPDHALGAKVDVTLPTGATVASHVASDGTYDEATGTWDLGALRHRDYRTANGHRPEATLTLILEGGEAADATATISNDNDNHPYRVVIDGTTHTGTVYDYIDANNTATLTARAGTGAPLPDTPEAGPQSLRSVSAVVLEWQPVPTVNGWPVSHYEVQRSSSEWEDLADNAQCLADAAICRYADTTAKTGQMYRYRVRAVNSFGVAGPWSSVMQIGVAAAVGASEAPVLAARPNEPNGREQILLTWTKPVENGSSITSYTIEVADRSNGPWAEPDPAPTLGPEATSWTHAGLNAGTRKYYRLKATNGLGDSPWSKAVEVSTRAAGIPAAPTNVRAAPDGGNAIDVSWEPPPYEDETPIVTRYEVQRSADGVSGWRSAGQTADGETLTFKDSGLAFGETRRYRVAARNSRGLSDWSHPPYATATTLAGVPGVPGLTARAEFHDTINLTWTKPADNGSEITVYNIQWSEDGRPGGWQDLAGVSPADVTGYADVGLGPVTTRHYRVRAVNGAGAGTWSRAASATTPVKREEGVGPPTAPLNLTVLPGDGFIEAVWDPPASDGGAAIKDYSVQFRGSGSWEDVPHVGTHTDTSIYEHSNGTQLTNGRRYYVRVAAINESGYTGPWAQASAVPNKPQVPPSEPRNVEQTGGHGHIVVTWREPYDPGHPELTGYKVQYREDCSDDCTEWLPATPISASATDRSATITGLTNGTTYQVMVWAVNRAGDSPRAGADGALKATPQQAGDGQGQPPTNPRNLRLSPGAGQITVSWSAPSDRGDPAFAGYQVQYRCRWCGYDEWADWTTLTFGHEESTTATRATITGLEPEMDYQVRVMTVDNGYGSGLAIAQTRTR